MNVYDHCVYGQVCTSVRVVWRSFSIVREIAWKCTRRRTHDPSWARSDSRTVLLIDNTAGWLDRPSALSASLCGVRFEELVAVCLFSKACTYEANRDCY
jgi:hypothetical protein